MENFQPAKMPKQYFDVINIAETQGCSIEEAHKIAARFRREKVFLNDFYQVNMRYVEWPGGKQIAHLSIKRRDKEAIHDWRHIQEIKNLLVGEECEGFELYPAESRLVDEANQYHLWVFTDSTVRIPVGDYDRKVGTPEDAAKYGAKQRAWEPKAANPLLDAAKGILDLLRSTPEMEMAAYVTRGEAVITRYIRDLETAVAEAERKEG